MTKRPAIDFAEAKPFDIFRAGTHTPMTGESIAFGDADLAAIADGYDPGLSQAPIVVGHPKVDAPAYGWIDSLAIDGDRLQAVPAQVDPAFADLVRAGRFKKVSASFYRPGQANNPTPEGYYLRHVGFLGATPPAVKGLRPVEFAEDDACLTVEFGDWATASGFRTLGRLFRGLRDWIVARDGIEAADKILPDWDISTLSALPAEIDPPQSGEIAYADPIREDDKMTDAAELEAREAALRNRETELERRAAAFAEAETARRAGEDEVELDGLVAAGRLPSSARPIAEALFAEVRAIETTVDFGDGETNVQATPRHLLTRLLRAMPLPVVTGELAVGEVVDFADPDRVRDAIEKEIVDAAARGETLTAASAAVRIKGKGR